MNKYKAALAAMRSALEAWDKLPEDATEEQRTEAREAFESARDKAQEIRSRLEAEGELTAAEAAVAESEDRAASEQVDNDSALEEARASLAAIGRESSGSDAEQRSGAGSGARVTSEPAVYHRGNANERSYFLDLARASMQGDSEARQRLARHGRSVQEEYRRRETEAERRMQAGVDELLNQLPPRMAEALRASGALVETRDLTRTDGAGGDFVPPLYLMDEYAEFARFGSPFADSVRNLPLPAGTDSINVPRITGGTATGIQTADNTAVQETDMTTATVTAPVRTIAGQQDVAVQLLDQSPIAYDQLVFGDLVADYQFRKEDQCLNGTGASGQVLGIRNTAGINAVTYTDASPTVPELYPKIADALNQGETARKRPLTQGFIAPRRFWWITAALDSQNRPLVTPTVQGPTNALGVRDTLPQLDGQVLQMLATFQKTGAMPTNLGAGTNEDAVVITRPEDHILFESSLRARVYAETLSGNLTWRFQVYGYLAFTAGRFPAATSVISGTGLVTPTF